MEFADTINRKTVGSAVDLPRRLRIECPLPLVVLTPPVAGRTFGAGVTDGDDAAQHQVSALHGDRIEEVVLGVAAFDAAGVAHTTDTAADCFPDRND
ncbi:hypothetical protein [uncultured Brevundimonas sp.]|jgi:hypothetical protein|uniref:hypothetical protein n=1 Tax=uncultured Brevundimonas sp. TaxID=213418 RepID=UPI0030ECA49F|tara:strand:+ start:271 stop:561 length:291 start_codon:yes stop_codon:yes gene_type:complete